MTPDLLPALDRLEGTAGLVLTIGLSGHGFGMEPLVRKLVSKLVLDGAASLDLSAFRFSRFGDCSRPVPHPVV